MRRRRGPAARSLPARIAARLGLLIVPGALAAQTDFHDLDAERPVAVQDAAPVKRYAFDLEMGPARVEQEAGGPTVWSLAPELAYGILPRTEVSLGLRVAALEGAALVEDAAGVSGLEVEFLHQLNHETLGLPALALSGGVLLPVGGLADEAPRATLEAVVTRSLHGLRRGTRIHANLAYTLGDPDDAAAETATRRWLAGVALDHTFVFQSLLIAADVFADRPLEPGAGTRWVAGAGLRYQLGPRVAIDLGVERRIGDEGPDWALTLGASSAFSIRSLIPVPDRAR